VESCDLKIDPIRKNDFDAEARAIASGWVIVQTFEKIRFEQWSGGVVPELDVSIAGRIFTENTELRWVRDGNAWHAWRIEEVRGFTYTRKQRKYFLWGIWKDGEFAELRIPAKLEYPIPASTDGERPYIVVAEYSNKKPDTWPSNTEEIEALLNAPAIAAHRFLAVSLALPEKDQNEP
jgi:hypothetical protein